MCLYNFSVFLMADSDISLILPGMFGKLNFQGLSFEMASCRCRQTLAAQSKHRTVTIDNTSPLLHETVPYTNFGVLGEVFHNLQV